MMGLRLARAAPDRLETMHPAYFAMVMATGIIAIGFSLHGFAPVANGLFALNIALFILLSAALFARLAKFPAAVIADIKTHSRSVGFFTIVAATGVLGTEFLVQAGERGIASALLIVAALLLAIMTYGILTVLTVIKRKPTIVNGLNGGWLVCIVATQSVSRLITLVVAAGGFAKAAEPLMFAALVLWLGGGALYIWIMTLIFFRYTFLPMAPTDLSPPYWINMGAVAISSLAGLTLIENAHLSPVVAEIAPFAKGFTLFFWSIGTWWIPMLFVLGLWRHLLRGMPLSYDPLYWGAVFPLGMYSVSTYHLTVVFDAPFLGALSETFLFIALAAWAATALGLLISLVGRLQDHARAAPPAANRQERP